MKKILSALLSVVMILSVFTTVPVTVFAADGNTTEFAGGSGTEEDPYLISTVDRLDNVRYYLDAHFKMISDIDLTEAVSDEGEYNYGGRGWQPIGGSNIFELGKFNGVFDGNGCIVSGLRINDNSSYSRYKYIGLFSHNAGVIKNLNVAGAITSQWASYASYGIYIGGIAGQNSGQIANCSSAVEITVGGDDCYNQRNSVRYRVGGITGYNDSNSKIDECYNTGMITCKTYETSGYVGGIAGYAYDTISNCYNAGKLNITSDVSYNSSYPPYVCGIVGYGSNYNIKKVIMSVKSKLKVHRLGRQL